jgi:hypothetical protein
MGGDMREGVAFAHVKVLSRSPVKPGPGLQLG